MKPIILSKYVSLIFSTPNNSGNWFGYYNYSPLNQEGDKLLCNKAIVDAVIIKKGMKIEIGYYNLPSGEWHHIGYSDSFNWPQGCMLQWLPTHKNKVIYNTSKNNHNISIIHDISTKDNKNINWSIYGITPDGNKSIALDMERSHWCRAYHYESVANEELNVRVAENDGVFEIDLKNNTKKRIISIQEIINIDKEPYFDHAKHWIEHIMISPSGKRFCFLHRFTVKELSDYETRLFVANIDGSNLQLINGWRNFYWSHFAWNGDDEFTIYTYKHNRKNYSNCANNVNAKSIKNISAKHFIRQIFNYIPVNIKKKIIFLIKGQTSYYQYYSFKDNKFKLEENIKIKEFAIDGHPSFTNDGRYMITDTYPDNKQYQHLIIYDRYTKKAITIAKLYAGLHKKPGSCDLHPKLCKNNTHLTVDTAFDKKHHMLVFKLNWELIKKTLN